MSGRNRSEEKQRRKRLVEDFKGKPLTWRESPEDERDLKFSAQEKFRAKIAVPDVIDFEPKMSPISDQGSLGSCTAHAIVAACEYMLRLMGIKTDLSELFLYYLERKLEGTIDEDSGAYIKDGFRAGSKWGLAPLKLWPYVIRRFRDEPPKDAFEAALGCQIIKYYKVSGVDELDQALARGHAVVFGAPIFESFYRLTSSRNVMGMPKAGEKNYGGHAMVFVGRTVKNAERKRRFKFRNSWGTDFGRRGYAYMEEDFVRKHCRDMWVVEIMENPAEAAKAA